MLPTVELFGRSIPTYWICALFGFIVCGIAAIIRHRNFKDLQQVDITNCAALIGIGIVVGGRILSKLTMLPVLIRNWDLVKSDWHIALELLSNGLVF